MTQGLNTRDGHSETTLNGETPEWLHKLPEKYLPMDTANVFRNEFDAEKLRNMGIVTSKDFFRAFDDNWKVKRLVENEEFRRTGEFHTCWPPGLDELHAALIGHSEQHNLIVTAGKNRVAAWFSGSFVGGWAYLGIDSSATAPLVTDTAEISAVGTRRVAGSMTSAGNVATQSFFFGGADSNGTWNSAVLAENLTGTPIYFRMAFAGAPITKDNTKTEVVDTTETIG